MTKKTTIPDNVVKRFDKAQYKLGDFVYYSFLGQKSYGYVKKITEMAWGICYTIESPHGTKYPCGIQIGEYRTKYYSGIVYYDETKQFGSAKCKRHYESAKRATRKVPKNTGGTTIKSRDDNSTVEPVISRTPDTVIPKTKTSSRKNDTKPSNKRVSNSNTKTGNNIKKPKTKLDDAIQKQRDFLNGFVKKD